MNTRRQILCLQPLRMSSRLRESLPVEQPQRSSSLVNLPTWILGLMLMVCLGWAQSGNIVSADEPQEQDKSGTQYTEPAIDDFARDHWAFDPIPAASFPDQPQDDAHWCRNEIDVFVLRELQKRRLQTQPEPSRRVLIRRLSFDLIGLPPSPQDVDEFLADARPDAYERLVEKLLESPQHGERWAQHWLDLARFAETDGFEHDRIRPDAWKYRDWVIQAINDDIPYDEFIRRQLAGDEIYPHDESAITATRFCLSGADMPDINLAEERRHTVLNELTSTVGEVFLGLQIGCAQCHDHKYDPISQADFYRFRAIFEPAVALKKNQSLATLNESVPYSTTSQLMLRGDFRRPGPTITPGVIRVISQAGFSFSPESKPHTAGLRTALAEWLVAPDNPLTSRVIVNRVWQHHFGMGLVSTPNEFGIMGSSPTHPELLDWLARTLMEDGWSLRNLHRRIVTSAAYRQRSHLTEYATLGEKSEWKKSQEQDPKAEYLSRYPRWRLEGEAIRDSMLAASGQLNPVAGGPGVRPPLPAELVGTLLKDQWDVTKQKSEHYRRSIYVFARRNLRYPIFEVFDRPSANTSCAVRGASTTAPQSLHLLNSEFTLTTSRSLASDLIAQYDTEPSRVEAAFQRILNRPPSDIERDDLRDFFRELEATPTDQLTHLCLALFNSNEFVTID